jgi:putative membrane protein
MITTATSRIRRDFKENTMLKSLILAYAIVWVITAINPSYRTDWILENILVAAFLPILFFTYRCFTLSNLSYLLITLFMMLHAVGAHYTYAEVPFGFWLKDEFHLSRNHFDRIVHFSFGLLMAYPIREVFLRVVNVRGFWAYYFPLDVTLSFSALYEIIEMLVAKIVSPQAGDAYLGTQGDPFDSDMDMTSAFAGAIICMLLTAVFRRMLHKGPELLAAAGPNEFEKNKLPG